MTQETKLAIRGDALPTSFEEIQSMANAFVQSGMFADTRQLAQAIVKIQAGRELGLPPVYSMQNINLIRNRLTTSANTMAMLVKKSGRYNYRIKQPQTDTECTVVFYERDGDKWTEVGESTFTMADAKRAELVKPDSGWVKFPRAMLFSRAISQGARIYAPDAIGGVYTDEEIRAIPPRPEESEPTASQDAPGTGGKAPTSAIPQPEAKAVPAAQGVQQEQDFDKLGHMTGLVNAGQFYTAVHRDFGLNPSQVSKMEPVIGLIKAGKFNEAYDEVKIQGAREGTK